VNHKSTVQLRGVDCSQSYEALPASRGLPAANLRRDWASLLTIFILTALPLDAQREPVLKQIDLPHRYYYREMYLPQLTTGSSSAAWSSDSHSLVYSMGGTLWRQALDSGTAEQLTAGTGYDYQPDCSPDGRWVAYVSYRQDAMELWVLKRRRHETEL
jgi:hypothetical protein